MNENEQTDISQEKWLGAKWSSWGCLAMLGSIGIALTAIVTVIYGIFTTPQAFGPEGKLSPDPALMPPFEPPPEWEKFAGIPPIGVAEFTTGHPLRLNDAIFTVTRVALDWSPGPPRTPEVEYTLAVIRLKNEGNDLIELGPEQFRMITPWGEEATPIQELGGPDALVNRIVRPGETAAGALVFARYDIREVRRYLIYDPPYRSGAVRVLLVPGGGTR